MLAPAYATLTSPSYYLIDVLQSSASLGSGWTLLTNNPVVTGYQQSVKVGASATNSFFRLLFQP